MIRRAAVVMAALAACCPPLSAAELTISAAPVTQFKSAAIGEPVDGLIWQGGLELDNPDDRFGGLSSITFTGPDHRLAMVTDRGNFVAGRLVYDDDGIPLGLIGVTIDAIHNSKDVELPRQFARDAEGMDTVYRDGKPVAVRVAFENLSRVADFALVDGVPGGPAREVNVPDWVTRARTNEAIESICIAPPASPVAGSTLLIGEQIRDAQGNHRATLLGNRDKGDLVLAPIEGVAPSDCAFLPNGDLLVLERGIAFFAFTMRLRLIPADQVHAGATMRGKVILSASGNDIDNMEGVTVHEGPDGSLRITLISDNNFNDWERSLLLEFSLPQ